MKKQPTIFSLLLLALLTPLTLFALLVASRQFGSLSIFSPSAKRDAASVQFIPATMAKQSPVEQTDGLKEENLPQVASKASTGFERMQTSAEPFLLADYADQCQAYMGEIPQFSCNDLTYSTIMTASILLPDLETRACPQLFYGASNEETLENIERTCEIPGSVIGKLEPVNPDVTILFGCRVYDYNTKPGYYDDINIIQYDQTTGNTCWFNSTIIPELDDNNNPQLDRKGNVVYTDIDGSLVPSPMSLGADYLWLDPYDPEDDFEKRSDDPIESYWANVRRGKRGIIADKNCQRCHDADPFIWTPIVAAAFPIESATSTASPFFNGFAKGKFVSNFLGVFDADGTPRAQPRRFDPRPSDSINQCSDCHYFGEYTTNQFGRTVDGEPVGLVDGKELSRLLEFAHRTTPEHVWMPPRPDDDETYPLLTDDAKRILQECAQNPLATPLAADGSEIDCGLQKLDPPMRTALQIDVSSSPFPAVAGGPIEYSIVIRSRAPYTASSLALTSELPDGMNLIDKPDDCSGNGPITCDLGDFQAGEERTIKFTGELAPLGSGVDILANQIEVTTKAEDTNISTVRVDAETPVRRDADLALSQNVTLESDGDRYNLIYAVDVRNHGPAAAENVIVSITLPEGALLDPVASSPLCRAQAELVRCELGKLDNGNLSTTSVIITVPMDRSPIFSSNSRVESQAGSGSQTTVQRDFVPANNQQTVTLIDPDRVTRNYLPLIANIQPQNSEIDLIVTDIALSSRNASVTIKNIGAGTLDLTGGFWVDLYIAPLFPPTGVNQIVTERRTNGLVWGVISPNQALGPNEELVLSVDDAYFVSSLSHVPDLIERDSAIYAQVDSADITTGYGAVLETHEINGQAYNNIYSEEIEETILPDWPMIRSANLSPEGETHLPKRE